jgi:hypothetical protein
MVLRVSHITKSTLSHPGENPRPKICDLWREMAGNTEKISELEKTEIFVLSPSCLQRGYAQFFFLAQKSNQNTWFSATLDFSLVFRWFSAVSPTLCTVVSKKTKLSCFGGF